MKRSIYLLILLIPIIALGCRSVSVRNLVVTDFTTTFDHNLELGKPNFKSFWTITVIDFKNIRAFIIPFYNERSRTALLPNGDVEEGSITYDTTVVYCMYEKGKKYGLRYDSLSVVSPQKFPVDSLLDRINIGNQRLQANSEVAGTLDYA